MKHFDVNVITELSALSGKITAAQANYVDSDTNNPDAFYASNNTADDAQIIPNVATVGGFMTFAATGNPGDVFQFSTDRVDIFRVFLSANQNITLTISDIGNSQDFDLYLYRTSDTSAPVASSIGTGQTELINVPADDEYFILLDSFAGTSNYVLTVGQLNPVMASSQVLRLEDEFIPGEIITKARPSSRILRLCRINLSLPGMDCGHCEAVLIELHCFGWSKMAGLLVPARPGQTVAAPWVEEMTSISTPASVKPTRR
jgi:hypothetical protein